MRRRLHFMGIGGVGMCGLAELAHARGAVVSGCDLAVSDRTERLAGLGIDVRLGHDPAHLDGIDAVVYSAAVSASNAELERARSEGIDLIRRAEMLGALLSERRGVAVAGTHGKTTTTALVGHLLTEVGLDPTVLVGGYARFAGSNARIGAGEHLVCEADEYDRAFLELRGRLAVVTNLEPEHLDCYATAEELAAAFAAFCNQTAADGCVILCCDDVGAWSLVERLERRVVGYGFGAEAELRAENVRAETGGSCFSVVRNGETLGDVELPLPGRFNILNALAAIAAGLELGVPFARLADGCSSFTGVARRFDVLGERGGITVVDDYAHHPTEIEAVLAAARQAFPDRRLVVVFQPHLYSRTREFADGFARALLGAEQVVVLPVYPARETAVEGVNEGLVVDAARAFGHPAIAAGPEVGRASSTVDGILEEGDVLLTLGAGDVHRVAEDWLGGAA